MQHHPLVMYLYKYWQEQGSIMAAALWKGLRVIFSVNFWQFWEIETVFVKLKCTCQLTPPRTQLIYTVLYCHVRPAQMTGYADITGHVIKSDTDRAMNNEGN
jgi:hypothetical protein